MSAPDNNAHRQVFGLSIIANSIRAIKGPERKLQELAEKRIPELLRELLPGWEVVWGPRVWKNDPEDSSEGPDHVFYIAKNSNLASNGEQKETYVLGIAGTATTYNWNQNNFRINQVVDLYKWLENGISTDPTPLAGVASSPESCYIALGIALGIYRLTSVGSPQTAASPGTTIPAYWASFPQSPNTRVIITGHSIGGALSSTLALALLESRGLDKFERSNILVYSTAGPTSGNLEFVKLFADRFPKVPGPGYQVWNNNIVNRLDVASHAWSTSEVALPEQNMHNIPSLYGKPLEEVKTTVDVAVLWANLSLTTYQPLEAWKFKGTPPTAEPTTRAQFLEVAGKQHMGEFDELFGFKLPVDHVLVGEVDGLQTMTSFEVARTEPVLGEIVFQIEAEERQKKDFEGGAK